MQEGKSLRADTTLDQTLQRLIENKKIQLVAALVLMLLAIRLYFPAGATPDAHLVDAPANRQWRCVLARGCGLWDLA